MPEFAWSVGAFIVVVGLLVVVHEFGHFYVARRCGVQVLRFSVGFGRALWLRRGRTGTEYVLAAIPFGGYVRMLDEADGDVPEAQRAQAFNRQPVGARMAIVAAGPAANFLLAIAAYWVMFVVGIQGLRPELGAIPPDSPAAHASLRTGDLIETVAGRRVQTWDEVTMRLLDGVLGGADIGMQVRGADGALRSVSLPVPPGSSKAANPLSGLGLAPAQQYIAARIGELEARGAGVAAGFQAGDLIESANGAPVQDWEAWVQVVRASAGRTLSVQVNRAGERLQLTVTPSPSTGPQGTIGRVGMAPRLDPPGDEHYTVRRYGVFVAVPAALQKTWDVTGLSLRMLGKMVMGDASIENLSGPVTIARFAGQSARIGPAHFLSFLALVSVSLGLLNLLPIPVLDGGHLLYHLVEWVRGAPLPDRARAIGQQGGLVLLMGLTALALYNDLARLFS